MFSLDVFSKCLIEILTGKEVEDSKIIIINKKLLSKKGDLSFPLKINYWRGYVSHQSEWFKSSKTILDYYELKKNNGEIPAESDQSFLLTSIKNDVSTRLKQIVECTDIFDFWLEGRNNFVTIHFNRSNVSCSLMKAVINQRSQYGIKKTQRDIKFYFKINCDDSEMTNLRLKVIKNISGNLLNFQGCFVQNEECENNYLFTTKSEGKISDNYSRYLCGSILNIHKKKEKNLTVDMYKKSRIEKIKLLNSKRCIDIKFDEANFEKDVNKIANAAMIYELSSSKHISPLIVEIDDDSDRSIKEASFILYNYARMAAILEKYTKLVSENEFPVILSIESMNNFSKVTDDESWALIFNYILKYPDVLQDAVTTKPKLNINIYLVWSFVSNLCHDFSKYYRRSRILIKGADSNREILEITSEKLHMVKALQIILKNCLSLLGIEEILCM